MERDRPTRETLTRLTPPMRRYAHALLASLPAAPQHGAEARARRADQDADELVRQALLGVWRGGGGDGDERGLRLALYRRIASLANEFLSCAEDAQVVGELAAVRRRPRRGRFCAPARAMASLPLDLRAIIALTALERLDYRAIGEVLDMPAERVLARLAVARAKIASEISGRRRPHLFVAAAPAAGGEASQADLHGYADNLLEPTRRAEVRLRLAARPELARRAAEWRRQNDALLLAYRPLLRQPPPPWLNFSALEVRKEAGKNKAGRKRGLLAGLAALLPFSSGRWRAAPRPF